MPGLVFYLCSSQNLITFSELTSKTYVLNSENAVRHPADVASADTHYSDVVIVQEREGSVRQVSSKRSFPSEKFITMEASCLVRLSWCNGWHCCHISRNRRFEFLPEVFVRFSAVSGLTTPS